MKRTLALLLIITVFAGAFVGCELANGLNIVKASKGLEFDLMEDGNYRVMGTGTCEDKDVVIPRFYKGKPVTRIESGAFMDCTWIESVVIPKSVTHISDLSFKGCTSLEKVYFANTSNWKVGIFEYDKYYDSYSFVLVPIEEDISDPSVAAKLLTSTYVNNVLKINE